MSSPRVGGIAAPNWSDKEVALLKKLWGTLSINEVAAKCGRTRWATQKKARGLGLPNLNNGSQPMGSPPKPKPEPPASEASAPAPLTDEEFLAAMSEEDRAEELSWRAFKTWTPPKVILPPPEHIPHAMKCQHITNWKGTDPKPATIVMCGQPTSGKSFCPHCAKDFYSRSHVSEDQQNFSSSHRIWGDMHSRPAARH